MCLRYHAVQSDQEHTSRKRGIYLNSHSIIGRIVRAVMAALLFCALPAQAAKDYIVAPAGGDITGAQLSAKLAVGNVTLQSSDGGTPGSGNILIKDVVAWSANTTLTLKASNNVVVNGNIAASGNTAGLAISPATANGGEAPAPAGTYRLAGAVITLSGSGPSLIIAGSAYTVINGLGAATDATSPPVVPSLQGAAAAANLAKNYVLGSDIDASASSAWNDGAGFVPIGGGDQAKVNADAPFAGRFDGLGHTIRNLTVNAPGKKWGGLFGATAANAQVRNMGLIDANVSGLHRVGGLVGENNGSLDQCHVRATVAGTNNVGALVGYNAPTGVVEKSYASGSVTGNGQNAGGLIGANSGTARNGYSTAAVGGTATNAGGLVGNNFVFSGSAPLIENSYATGAVSGTAPVGGLVGANGGTVSNGYWDSQTSGQAASAGGGKGLTSAQMKTQSSFGGFDFSGTWVMVDGLTQPMLAQQNSTTIYNVLELQLMAANLAANYTLGADIDASATGTGSGIWGSSGFVPIGTATAPFTGSLDGKGHTIGKLTINLPGTDHVGLFGYTGASSAIRNVGLRDSTVTGQNSVGALAGHNGGSIGSSYAEQVNVTGMGSNSSGSGGLVGTNGGSIGNSHTSGSVTGIDDVGGLVGVNSGSIAAAYSLATVSNATGQAGGLVGTNDQAASISASFATGVVGDVGMTGEMGGLVGLNQGSISYSNALGRADCGTGSSGGGLVGNNSGTIANSYATGGVSGKGSNAGGLVGNNSTATASIGTSYATGSVAGSGNVGGLVGNNDGTVSNGYWNSGLSHDGIAAGTKTGATGLSPAQMLASSNFSGFTITTTPGAQGWVVVNTDGSLQTAASNASAATSPMLATEYATTVTNAHQLQLMLMNLGASYRLAANVAAIGTGNGEEVWGGLGFVPVGRTNAPFTGVLDGQGYRISHYFINRTDSNVGLFGYIQNATLQNLGLTSGRVIGGGNVGGLVGYSKASRINYCYVDSFTSASVTDVPGRGDTIGGLVGNNDQGTIANCFAEGIAYGHDYVGGLVGINAGGTISNSAAATNTNARNWVAGGLVAYNSGGTIENSAATGNVIAKINYLGGLVAQNYNNGKIVNSYAVNTLFHSARGYMGIGGLVGDNRGSEVGNSYWDKTTSGQSISAGGAGLTDAQMRQQSSFSSWDFADIWLPPTSSHYPALRNMPEGYAP